MAFKPTTYPEEKSLMYRLLKTQLIRLVDRCFPSDRKSCKYICALK